MNAINWFEIPVRDLDRAERFYADLTGKTLKRELFGGIEHAIFASSKEPGVGGALVRDSRRKPHADGTLVYLAVADVDAALARVRGRAEVVMATTDIGEPGVIALLRDSEGNVVGVHAPHRA